MTGFHRKTKAEAATLAALLAKHPEGLTSVEIARQLGLGAGGGGRKKVARLVRCHRMTTQGKFIVIVYPSLRGGTPRYVLTDDPQAIGTHMDIRQRDFLSRLVCLVREAEILLIQTPKAHPLWWVRRMSLVGLKNIVAIWDAAKDVEAEEVEPEIRGSYFPDPEPPLSLEEHLAKTPGASMAEKLGG